MRKLFAALFLTLAAATASAQANVTFFFDSVVARGKISGSTVTPAAGQMVWVLNSTGHFTKTNIGTTGQCWKVASSTTLGWGSCGGGVTPPTTTKGDLWGFDSADNRIPVGTNNQVLTADSAQTLGLKWATRTFAFSLPSELSVSGSPANLDGTVTATWASQPANLVFASPNLFSGTPSFRLIKGRDIDSSDSINIASLRLLDTTGGGGPTFFPASGSTSNVNFTMPDADGSSGQFLKTNGSGVLSFASGGAGTVTSVATTAPITGGTITSTGTIGISITTTNDGGAIVKQASSPGTQQSSANLNISGVAEADGGLFAGMSAISYAAPAGSLGLGAKGTGAAGQGFLELSSTQSDADAATYGQIIFTDPNNSTAANKRLASIAGLTDGTTANNRGGRLGFYTRPNAGTSSVNLHLTLDQAGNVVLGSAALATNATDGFLHLDSMAGAPSGTPTAYTGRVPIVIDTTNNKIMGFYGAAWVNLSPAGGGGGGSQGGTTSATFVPYASSANTLADSSMSWDNSGKILTSGIGGITFKGSTSGGPTFTSPATGGSVTFTLPSADGSNGQCIQSNGSATLSFGNCGGGATGGNFNNSTALGSEPGSPTTGDTNWPTNGVAIQRYANGTWANNWGPTFPLTYPPADVSTVTTTINNVGGYNSSATSIVVTSSSGFSGTPFLASWESEDIKVTTVSGTTWTITRGYNGTTAATHANGTTLTQLNWEWVNQGTATTTQLTNNGIFLTTPGNAALNMRARKRLIGSNTSLRVGFLPNIVTTGSQTVGCGLVLRESGTGKLADMDIRPGSSTQVAINHWASATSVTANDLAPAFTTTLASGINWFRVDPTGTNILYYTSSDGQDWSQILTVAKTTQFTTAPDEWGFMCWTNAAAANVLSAAQTVVSFKEQ